MPSLLRLLSLATLTLTLACCPPGHAQALSAALTLPAGLAELSGPPDLPIAPSFLPQQTPQPTSASLEGTITDALGGLIPNATITLSEAGHPGLRETSSDSTGHFRFTGLGPGSYTLLVAEPQFRTLLTPPLELREGEQADLPPIALAPAPAETSISVSANSTAVAEEELQRETRQRILGIVPNFYTSFIYDAAPLNARQKFKLNLRSVTDPTIFLGVAVTAGIEQYRNTFPSWGNDDAASYGKRAAAAYGDALLTRTFNYALYPALFHQDPRYFYLGPTNKMSTRIVHALTSGILTRGDNGRRQLNYSHLLGSASAGAASSVYHPRSDGPGYLAGLNLGIGIGGSALQAVMREFVWPRFTTHVPAYANGRTADKLPAKP
jgi:hypothetical protein